MFQWLSRLFKANKKENENKQPSLLRSQKDAENFDINSVHYNPRLLRGKRGNAPKRKG